MVTTDWILRLKKPLISNHKKIKRDDSSTCGLVAKLLHKIQRLPHANHSQL